MKGIKEMSEKKLNICVIGLSKMGDLHMQGVINKGANLYAVCDTAEDRVKAAMEKYNVKIGVTDYRELVNDPEIDAAVIVTPDYYHLEMTEAFLAALPEEFRDRIEPTYEIQIRTVFSEGWHEVEHDLRYKCKEDWQGCEPYSRALNGIIATLEAAEWNMKSIFADLARQNFSHSNYTAMLRNKFHLRFRSEALSESLENYLHDNRHLAEAALNVDRLIVVYTLLTHKADFDLTYDNLLFLINRIEMMDADLMAMEPTPTKQMLNSFLNS